jgi:tripartite-type tricarboxylate transporter receptor subunit TctC
MTSWFIRHTALIAAAVLTFATQSYAQQPLRIVLPFPPGGGTDTLTRVLASELSGLVGPVIVENKPGASGVIAASQVAKSAPDGRTLFFASNSSMVNNVALFDKLPYDPQKDFTSVAHIGYTPLILTTRADLPFKNLAELVAYGRANPGKLNRGSGGAGTINNFAGVVFEKLARIDMTHIPFAGDSQAIQAMLGGDLELYVSGITPVMPYVKAGKLRVLAVMDHKRLSVSGLPDVATFKESGYDLEAAAWYALVAPAGTPRASIDRWNEAVNQVLARGDVAQRIRAMGIEPRTGAPADVDQLIKSESQRWVPIIKSLGVKLD